VLGFSFIGVALDMSHQWDYPVGRQLFTFGYLIAFCIGIVLIGMAGWHWYLIAQGRTQLEWMEEDDHYRRVEAPFAFDFGWKQNIANFLNFKER
jgi:hypothetical protein